MEVKNIRYGLVKKLVFILGISTIFTMGLYAFPTGKYNCKHPIGQFEYILESNGKAKSIMRPMGSAMVLEGRGRWIDDYDTAILIFNGERGTRGYIHKEGNNFFFGEENFIIRMMPCQSHNSTGHKKEYNQPKMATPIPKVNNDTSAQTAIKEKLARKQSTENMRNEIAKQNAIHQGLEQTNQAPFDCWDGVLTLNYDLADIKKLSNPLKKDKLKDLMLETYKVADKCKNESNEDFGQDGENFLGTDNLKVLINSILDGDDNGANKILLKQQEPMSMTSEGKFISYATESYLIESGNKWGKFKINGRSGVQTLMLKIDQSLINQLVNNKNKTFQLKWNPEAGELYDVYLK